MRSLSLSLVLSPYPSAAPGSGLIPDAPWVLGSRLPLALAVPDCMVGVWSQLYCGYLKTHFFLQLTYPSHASPDGQNLCLTCNLMMLLAPPLPPPYSLIVVESSVWATDENKSGLGEKVCDSPTA